MTVTPSIDGVRLLEEQLAQASPDLLRELLTTFINTLMSAEADAVCGAAYGTSSPERTNQRNGYRTPRLRHPRRLFGVGDPPAADRDLLPRLAPRATQAGQTSPHQRGRDLLPARRQHPSDGQAGPIVGDHDLIKIAGLRDGQGLDGQVEQFRTRRLDDPGPFTFVAADALVLKVRESGRVVGVHCLVATGVDADGHRQELGVQVTTSEDGAGWLAFFRDLVARGLHGVRLVTSDAHPGLVAAITATLPGAAWRRCRTHYAANLMSATQEQLALGQSTPAFGLRPARQDSGQRPVRPDRRRPGGQVPHRRRPPRNRPSRHPRLHRVP